MIPFDVTPQQPDNGLTVLELFAGGGLMAVGLKSAGLTIVWANDFEKTAVRAYQHNIGDHIVHGDITQIDPHSLPDTDIIAGGPPCQDYSVAGTGEGEEGERGKLVWTYLNIIEIKQPKAFIFENVKGLVGKKHRHTFDALLEDFDRIGYTVSWQVINAWDYGVAQKRERVFVVGIRKDLYFTFQFPKPLEGDYRTQVLRDAIGDLPEPRSSKLTDATVDNLDPKELSEKAISYLHSKNGRSLKKHRPPQMDEPGQTIVGNLYKGVPYGLFYPENHHGGLFDNVGNNPTWEHANRVADLDAPAPTRTEKDRCDGINEINGRPRRFTVRECLRIQSVPDWYVLPDDLKLSPQYKIVGNGVASRVAWYLGRALADQLKSYEILL